MTTARNPESHTDASVAGSTLVEMRDICVSFGGVHAVQNVTVTLRAGEVVGLVGGNGAGKTTLMRVPSTAGRSR
jgi:D-xylose transport system ATP-binding protein